jgi:hypothetical protein
MSKLDFPLFTLKVKKGNKAKKGSAALGILNNAIPRSLAALPRDTSISVLHIPSAEPSQPVSSLRVDNCCHGWEISHSESESFNEDFETVDSRAASLRVAFRRLSDADDAVW